MELLIVEENGAMCRLVRALIEGLPVAVSECHDGAQALAACAEVLPDWVLIDLTLAGADALAVTRQLTTAYPHLRILLLTEDDDPRLRDIAAKAGVWAVVLKESLIDVRGLLDPLSADRNLDIEHGAERKTSDE